LDELPSSNEAQSASLSDIMVSRSVGYASRNIIPSIMSLIAH